MPFVIEWSPQSRQHLKVFPKHLATTVVDQVTQQLSHQPLFKTRNRKELRENPRARWELRVGDLRVLYDVLPGESIVRIVAVGEKRGDQYFFDGKACEL